MKSRYYLMDLTDLTLLFRVKEAYHGSEYYSPGTRMWEESDHSEDTLNLVATPLWLQPGDAFSLTYASGKGGTLVYVKDIIIKKDEIFAHTELGDYLLDILAYSAKIY